MERKIEEIPAKSINFVSNKAIKRKVCGYARVSTDKDEQFTSYEAQIDYYKDYISRNPNYEYVNVYTDEGISGTTTAHREGFKKMISDALEGKIDLIITKSISRFARNTVDSLTTIRLLKEHNVEVFFEKENIYTFDGKGELLITIMSSLAQEESRSISENVTWGMRQAMKAGKVWVPYKNFLGYDKGNNGKLVINNEESFIVRRIYCMFLAGYSVTDICNIFMKEKLLPPNKDKTTWHVSTIKSILQNEKYIGNTLMGKTHIVNFLNKKKIINNGESPKYFIKNNHTPIIGNKMFQRVQDKIKSLGFNNSFLVADNHKTNDLILGNLRCGCCGYLIGKISWHPKSKYAKEVYRCNNKYTKNKCNLPTFDLKDVRKAFYKALHSFVADYSNCIEIMHSATFFIPNLKYLRLEIEILHKQLLEFPKYKKANNERIVCLTGLISDIENFMKMNFEEFQSLFKRKNGFKYMVQLVALLEFTINEKCEITVKAKKPKTIKKLDS